MRTPHSRRIYDYRIRQTFCETGDRDLFPELNIPRSTVRSWILRGVPNVSFFEWGPGLILGNVPAMPPLAYGMLTAGLVAASAVRLRRRQ
jgi:hypothetical protein